jgi:hypothetical protein
MYLQAGIEKPVWTQNCPFEFDFFLKNIYKARAIRFMVKKVHENNEFWLVTNFSETAC